MTDNRIKKSCSVFMAIVLFLLSGCGYKITVPALKHAEPAAEIAEADDTDETEDTVGPSGDLIIDDDFTEKSSRWNVYKESGGNATVTIGQGKLTLHILSPGIKGHSVQLYYDGFELLEGGRYHFSCEISSDVERHFEWRIQQNGGDYHPYASDTQVEIGPQPTEFSCDFIMEEASDPSPRLCFNLGDADSAQGLGEHTIVLDNVILTADTSAAKEIDREQIMTDININQIGYHPEDEKRAVFRKKDNGDDHFDVIDTKTGKSVLQGDITEGLTYGSSGDRVCYADFSELKTPGKYKVTGPVSGESYEFVIADDVYDDALVDSLRMLYLQRCGCELSKELAGDFGHGPCHTEEAQVYGSSEYIDVSGGWHDAGDYGRYVVPGAKTVADLLLSYELYPSAFGDNNNIPESGNGIPDILDEARYELDWMFKMQAGDGGVYHKVTGLEFDDFCLANECTAKLYVLPKSKTASADFAAAMYMAARVYRGIDPEFADRCISAADRALEYYEAHAKESNFTNPGDVKTGEYGDGCSVDEYLWAICEGYKTTGDARFEKKLADVDFSKIKNDGLGWDDMSGYAYYAYMSTDKPMISTFDFEKRFYEYVDNIKEISLRREAYGSSIGSDYPWGSNMIIANNGMALLMAYGFKHDEEYRLAAKRQLDYLLGTNSTSYCFLTGYGTQTPEHPHHRPSEALQECMKGMLVGGPDSRLEDPYAKAVLSGLPKARCYVDNAQSYSCNEITIYWNSPLCFLFAGLK